MMRNRMERPLRPHEFRPVMQFAVRPCLSQCHQQRFYETRHIKIEAFLHSWRLWCCKIHRDARWPSYILLSLSSRSSLKPADLGSSGVCFQVCFDYTSIINRERRLRAAVHGGNDWRFTVGLVFLNRISVHARCPGTWLAALRMCPAGLMRSQFWFELVV